MGLLNKVNSHHYLTDSISSAYGAHGVFATLPILGQAPSSISHLHPYIKIPNEKTISVPKTTSVINNGILEASGIKVLRLWMYTLLLA